MLSIKFNRKVRKVLRRVRKVLRKALRTFRLCKKKLNDKTLANFAVKKTKQA